MEGIIEFWFGKDFRKNPLQKQDTWFTKDPSFDAVVAKTYGSMLESAPTKAREWNATAEGSMAFILLTDQFPRNIHRGKPEAFAYDSFALDAAKNGVDRGFDQELHWVQRVFYYLPFEHSEDLAMQERSLELFQSLVMGASKDYVDTVSENYDYAVRHWEIIKRFGRFPHRNAILGRASTAEEVAFLQEPNSSF